MFNEEPHGRVQDIGVWADKPRLKNCHSVILVSFEFFTVDFLIVSSSFRRELVRSRPERIR